MPGTSFQSTTRRAPSARASSVAVRSEPPRPRVVMLPSGARPMKPGTTGMTRFLSSGFRIRSDSSAVSPRFGAAPPWTSSVRMTSRASTNRAGRRAPAIAAATMVAASCSPRETSASRVRGARCRRTPSARQRSRYSATDASIDVNASRNALPRPSTVFAAAWWRSRRVLATRLASSSRPSTACAAPSSSRSVTPPSAEATTTRGPPWAAIRVAARAIACPSASDAPPNFHTSRACCRRAAITVVS